MCVADAVVVVLLVDAVVDAFAVGVTKLLLLLLLLLL